MALTNFGEAFAKNCLRKFYFKAITPVIANTDYEGEVKAMGDRVNILMFLDDITLSDYTANTNMSVQYPTDTESILHINRQKYWNFNIDRVDKLFTYVDDEDSTLIENASDVLAKAIDTELLKNAMDVQAGHIVPNGPSAGTRWNYVVGNVASYVTITTAASWGIASCVGNICSTNNTQQGIGTETGYFPTNIVGRGIRFCSNNINSPWFRITARTSSFIVTFNNWDGSTTGDDHQGLTGYSNSYLKGLFYPGGFIDTLTNGLGYGAQIEGCRAPAVTSANVYKLVCEMAQKLDEEGIPAENRYLTIPAWFKAYLVQAAQLQPDIAMYYTDTVINGKVGRVAGFDIHVTSDDRFSTCASPYISQTANAGGLDGVGTLILANHKSWITFAHKWSESRVVDAELQFAKLYQGLNLYGFRVTPLRRKAGVMLFARQG